MFLRYFEFLWRPFRDARNKYIQARNIHGNIKVDIQRVKSYKQVGKMKAKEARAMAGRARGQMHLGGVPVPGGNGGPPPGARFQMSGGAASVGAGAGNLSPSAGSGYAGVAGMPSSPDPAGQGFVPPIHSRGSLWWKKNFCGGCGQELDKSWDHCPYCAKSSVPPSPKMKTQAISMDAAGHGQGHQMLAWLVPLRGPQRGELFTLSPITSVGTDAVCTVVLIDQYMSGRHAEIKVEGGQWILRDLRSTNGTYVNDKRIEQHELVDSDFVRFGQSLVKFKCM